MNTNISLRQGVKFKKYQSKINHTINRQNKPKKEGYINIFNKNEKNVSFVNQQNKSDEMELRRLEKEFDNLLKEYTNLETSTETSASQLLARYGSDNKYKGQNIRFNEHNAIGYVTNLSQYKWYAPDIINDTVGKNGCPPMSQGNVPSNWSDNPFNLMGNISGSDNYSIPGSVIQTNPTLSVGTPMVRGQSCGNEGQNVYVNKMVNNPTMNYIGCYKDFPDGSTNESERAMIFNPNEIGYTTFDNCKLYAEDKGYKYFAMQDVQTNGIAACLVSNDLPSSQKYGESMTVTTVAIWSSATSNVNEVYMQVGTGQIILWDKDGNKQYSVPEQSVAECDNWGGISNVQATWGSNCNGQDSFNVTNGNATDAINSLLPTTTTFPSQLNYQIGVNMTDPATGCQKAFDISYKCGNMLKTGHINPESVGQYYQLDCTDYQKSNCQFFLILQDDGNMCIYKGTPDNNLGFIWNSGTNGKQLSSNAKWTAANGKNGRNYLTTSETLMAGEWIGSNNGCIMLIMQEDGNLVLYASNITSGCSVESYGQAGGPSVNAIYELSEVGDTNWLGKVGYVNEDTILKEYPSSMLGLSNDYDIYPSMDSVGNDLGAINMSNIDECEKTCNSNPDCAGFVWETAANICWPKNKNIFPNGPRNINSATTLGIRRPTVLNDVSCPKNLADIDSSQYANYVKGEDMTSTTSCSVNIVSNKNNEELNKIKDKMYEISNKINDKINKLYKTNLAINNDMSSGASTLNNDIQLYYRIQDKISSALDNTSNYPSKNIDNLNKHNNTKNISSYSMTEPMLNMQDLNAMINDSDLVVLQNNYQYILWSIIALGSVIITVNALKK